MKQLLFLLLFPCLALAQYSGNAGQKITLGEQTSADGLVYRGVTADTANLLTNKLDTSVYIVLDTGTRAMWYYRASTTPKWTRLVDSLNNMQGQLSLTTKVTGVLPVANGGTNASTFTEGSVVFAGASGTYTEDNSGLFYDNTNNRLGINTASPLGLLEARSTVGGTNNVLVSLYQNGATSPYFTFQKAGGTVASPSAVQANDGMGELTFSGYAYSTFNPAVVLRAYNSLAPGATYLNGGFRILINSQANGGLVDYLNIISNGHTGIGDGITPTEKLHVGGNVRITAMNGIGDIGADANGVLQAATSDMNLKNTIENSPFGLNEILLLNPVTFLYNDENRKIDSDVKEVGFIAQDVFDVIPNAVSSTGTGDLQLDYRAITATLTKAIQEQQALIKALEQRLLILENK